MADDVQNCKACGSPAPSFLELGASAPGLTRTSYRAHRCPVCTLVFTTPDPPATDLKKIYGAELATEDPITGDRWREQVARDHWLPLLADLEKHLDGRQIFDVGCADGFFLDLAAERGWTASGIDPNPRMIELAAQRHGDQVRVAQIADLELPAAEQDAVRLCHVIEHLTDPVAALTRLHRALRPKGILSLALPIVDPALHYGMRLLPIPALQEKLFKVLGRLFPPMHLTSWSTKALTTALDRTGYDVVAVSYVNDAAPWASGYRRYWLMNHALSLPLAVVGSGMNIEVLARKRVFESLSLGNQQR